MFELSLLIIIDENGNKSFVDSNFSLFHNHF